MKMEHGHEVGGGVDGLKAAGSWSVFGSLGMKFYRLGIFQPEW